MTDTTVLQYVPCTLLCTLPICPEFLRFRPSLEIPREGGLQLYSYLYLNKSFAIGHLAVTMGL